MTVLILEKVTASLRGELTRWLLEVKTGVFVGRVSAMVREKLWEQSRKYIGEGGAVLIHHTATEQGYTIRTCGPTSRSVVDFDGLQFMRIRKW